jgi:hypothetical protein
MQYCFMRGLTAGQVLKPAKPLGRCKKKLWMRHLFLRRPLHEKLEAFDTYDHYLRYARDLFDLTPDEHAALFQVLVKLESVGSDPMETLHTCRFDMETDDCLSMLKFMMYVDGLDLLALKETA